MKLPMNILKNDLSAIVPVTVYGNQATNIHMSRPLLYDEKSPFKANTVYITNLTTLTKQPQIETGAIIICIGNSPEKVNISPHWTLLLLNTKQDMSTMFNTIQDIFDKYAAWDAKLKKVIINRGNINELLEASSKIFGNTLFVLDPELRVVAQSSPYTNKKLLSEDYLIKSEPLFKQFLLIKNIRQKTTVYKFEELTTSKIGINLFDDKQFIGGLYVNNSVNNLFEHRNTELLNHLKKYILYTLNQYNEILSVNTNKMKMVFLKVLDGTILKDTKLLKEVKLNSNENDNYVCIKFKLANNPKIIQTKSVCQQIESMLPGTIAMVYQNTIVAFMNDKLVTRNPLEQGSLLISFLQTMGYKAGISEGFSDILKARYYFKAACAAIDIGYPLNPELKVYYFVDYIKEYIYSMITSEIQTEMICNRGLLELLKYDQLHKTTYFHELQMYINCNMNAVQAAKKLYMHRNTLLTHLDQIIKLTAIDLEDPDERMHIQLSYKLLEKEGVVNLFSSIYLS